MEEKLQHERNRNRINNENSGDDLDESNEEPSTVELTQTTQNSIQTDDPSSTVSYYKFIALQNRNCRSNQIHYIRRTD